MTSLVSVTTAAGHAPYHRLKHNSDHVIRVHNVVALRAQPRWWHLFSAHSNVRNSCTGRCNTPTMPVPEQQVVQMVLCWLLGPLARHWHCLPSDKVFVCDCAIDLLNESRLSADISWCTQRFGIVHVVVYTVPHRPVCYTPENSVRSQQNLSEFDSANASAYSTVT